MLTPRTFSLLQIASSKSGLLSLCSMVRSQTLWCFLVSTESKCVPPRKMTLYHAEAQPHSLAFWTWSTLPGHLPLTTVLILALILPVNTNSFVKMGTFSKYPFCHCALHRFLFCNLCKQLHYYMLIMSNTWFHCDSLIHVNNILGSYSPFISLLDKTHSHGPFSFP